MSCGLFFLSRFRSLPFSLLLLLSPPRLHLRTICDQRRAEVTLSFVPSFARATGVVAVDDKYAVHNRTVKRHTLAHEIAVVALLHRIVGNSSDPTAVIKLYGKISNAARAR